jgi:glucose/arabinose dehydrogenase
MRRHLVGALVATVIAAFLPMLGAQSATAATFPPGTSDTVVTGGLGSPTAVASLPDGRLLVSSQVGKLWVVATNGTKSVALDLAAVSKLCSNAEEGLLGVTADPQFATNGFVYVYYTARVGSCTLNGASAGGAKNRVSRFTVTGSSVNPATELILLDNMPEWGGNHNGGEVRVANDGTIFVTVGDGGAGSPSSNPSDLSLPNGKVLRINRNGTPVAGNPHGTTACKNAWGPPGASKVCGEIWADGLRNPFRLGFDVSAPGAKFRINDVGDGTWEEVDDAIAGAHYGWPCREARDPHASSSPCATPVTNPVLFYNHSTGCNVETGGAFVPRGVWPGFDGAYLWVDYGCGKLFVAQPGQTGVAPSVLATGLQSTTDLEFLPVAGSYSLFYTTYANGGQLHRLIGAPTPDHWEALGGATNAKPAVASWAAGRLDTFIRGTDNQLWHRWYQGGWSRWEPLGGVLASGPAVVARSVGHLDVFIRGTDNQLWHKWFQGGRWSGWEPLGGATNDAPAVASWAAGRLDVFIRGTDNQLWHKWYGGRWSGWQPLGGVLASGPATESWSSGRLDVFIRGTDNQLWHKWYQGAWSGWQPLGGATSDAPAVSSWAAGRLDVFIRGAGNQLQHKWFQGGGWSGFETLGGELASGPAAVSWAVGRIDVFVRGTDNGLWHKRYDGQWH